MERCANTPALPFRTQLDFRPLVRYWQNRQKEGGIPGRMASLLLDEIAAVPEFAAPITDPDFSDTHRVLVSELLAPLVSRSQAGMDAVCIPFHYDFIWMSDGFREILRGCRIVNEERKHRQKLVFIYSCILNTLYGMDLDAGFPMTIEIGETDSSGNRHFQMLSDHRFTDILCEGPLPELTPEDREAIRRDVSDTGFLLAKLPPEKFIFSGIVGIQAVEITLQNRLSGIKQLVLERGSILSMDSFNRIQEGLRFLINSRDVHLSVAALQDEQILMLNKGIHDARHCIFGGTEHFPLEYFTGSVFAAAVKEGRAVLVHDLGEKKKRTAFEDFLVAHEKRNIYAAPLVFEGRVIGVLGLGSAVPGTLNTLNTSVLEELLPVFSHALERSLDEFEDRIQHMIQARFTSIHPSVHWRFRKEAIRLLEMQNATGHAEDEPILFDHVYPLYSVTDIRGSSYYRNKAIQADLIEHLGLARGILEKAYLQERLPIFDEIMFRIDGFLEGIREDLSTGDELQVINFLKNSVEPCFKDITGYSGRIALEIAEYFRQIDPRTGTVYRRRRDYDSSVSRINTTISSYLETVNREAQLMYPHYFDKQATDGVDQNIYLGASLAADKPFSPLYLKNMRLWQLIVMCETAHMMERLKPELAVPLETTHLIMVQDMPISIRFDVDEKKFRVDGAYNIRYEIMKKRIDKAVIKGSGERLTQPGMIAVVYSHNEEVQEYLEYASYLQSKRILLAEIEEHELEDLQGIRGLKAIRLSLDPEYMHADGVSVLDMIGEALPV